MNYLDSVSLRDWLTLAAGLVAALVAYLSSRDRLPSWAREWLGRVGTQRILDAIERAAALTELTPDQRRKQAVIYLQKLCLEQFGITMPASVANLLVEYVYQRYKKFHK